MNDRHSAEENSGKTTGEQQADPPDKGSTTSSGAKDRKDPMGGTVADAIRSARSRRD